jgi:hypothetical protein
VDWIATLPKPHQLLQDLPVQSREHVSAFMLDVVVSKLALASFATSRWVMYIASSCTTARCYPYAFVLN